MSAGGLRLLAAGRADDSVAAMQAPVRSAEGAHPSAPASRQNEDGSGIG
jgi:hypothetical protein